MTKILILIVIAGIILALKFIDAKRDIELTKLRLEAEKNEKERFERFRKYRDDINVGYYKDHDGYTTVSDLSDAPVGIYDKYNVDGEKTGKVFKLK